MSQDNSSFTAKVLMTWAARRAEQLADERMRHDIQRYVDDVSRHWRRRGTEAAITTGFALGAVISVAAAAGYRRTPRPDR